MNALELCDKIKVDILHPEKVLNYIKIFTMQNPDESTLKLTVDQNLKHTVNGVNHYKCPKCGRHEIEGNYNFCHFCGVAITF